MLVLFKLDVALFSGEEPAYFGNGYRSSRSQSVAAFGRKEFNLQTGIRVGGAKRVGHGIGQKTIILLQVDIEQELFIGRLKGVIYLVDPGRGIVPDEPTQPGNNHTVVKGQQFSNASTDVHFYTG